MPTSDHTQTVMAALRNRSSMPLVKTDTVPRHLVEQLMEAAASAPNHRRTEPWRFVVLAGTAREELGNVMAQVLEARLGGSGNIDKAAALDKERNKPLRAPVVIAVGCVPSTAPKVVEIEEIEATAAAVEHILLAAQALGLGAMWRTGSPAYEPAIKLHLGFPEHAHLVAFVYVGFPADIAWTAKTRSAQPHVTWRGWGDD